MSISPRVAPEKNDPQCTEKEVKAAEGWGEALVEAIRFRMILLHQGNDSILEVFRVLSDAEVQQKMKRKEKKAKKKAAQ